MIGFRSERIISFFIHLFQKWCQLDLLFQLLAVAEALQVFLKVLIFESECFWFLHGQVWGKSFSCGCVSFKVFHLFTINGHVSFCLLLWKLFLDGWGSWNFGWPEFVSCQSIGFKMFLSVTINTIRFKNFPAFMGNICRKFGYLFIHFAFIFPTKGKCCGEGKFETIFDIT